MTNQTMTDQRKKQIADDLREFVKRVGSANKASKMLNKISGGTISNILNDVWQHISADMWRNIESQMGGKQKSWNIAETSNYNALMQLYADAKEDSQVYGVVIDPGSSKSFTAKQFSIQNKDVFWLECGEFWNQRKFLKELLKAMGVKSPGYYTHEQMETIVEELARRENPLIIIDEADKLKDKVLYFFITIYNELYGHCGIILQATHGLRIRVRRGVERDTKGYKEILSRLGGKFVELDPPTKKDVTMICNANGVFDELTITEIWNKCDRDLRRVQRLVHAYKRKLAATGKEASHA